MVKKIRILLFATFFVSLAWTTFSDVIDVGFNPTIYRCVKFKNTTINSYKVIATEEWNYGFGPKKLYVYEPENKCLIESYWEMPIYLVRKWVNVNFINNNNLSDVALKIGNVKWNENKKRKNIWSEWFILEDWEWGNYDDEYYTEIYDVLYEGWEYKLKLIDSYEGISETDRNQVKYRDLPALKNKKELKNFVIAWILTVLIEILVLFIIAKLCWKGWTFKNRKIIFTWFLASTLTLPLFRFVLPLFFSNYWIYVVVWEILVTIIEIFMIKYLLKIKWGMAIFASVLCNLCSFLVWLFIF